MTERTRDDFALLGECTLESLLAFAFLLFFLPVCRSRVPDGPFQPPPNVDAAERFDETLQSVEAGRESSDGG